MAQRNTYNVYGRFEGTIGDQTVPIWLHIIKRWPSGGEIAVQPGDYIPAGTPIIIDKVGGTAKIFQDGVDDENDVIGLTWNDVYVHPSMVSPTATVAIVTDGTVLRDRLPETVTDALVEVMKSRTQILFANED